MAAEVRDPRGERATVALIAHTPPSGLLNIYGYAIDLGHSSPWIEKLWTVVNEEAHRWSQVLTVSDNWLLRDICIYKAHYIRGSRKGVDWRMGRSP